MEWPLSNFEAVSSDRKKRGKMIILVNFPINNQCSSPATVWHATLKRKRLPSRTPVLVSSLFGLAYASIVEISFFEFAVSFLDF